MKRHNLLGIFIGGIFALVITIIAAFHAFAAGGLILLATIVAGLAAGICIGALIAANFAMLGAKEFEEKEVPESHASSARAAA
jgi:hypothetical protein